MQKKTMHSLSLPKVLNYQFSKLNINESLEQFDSSLQTKSQQQQIENLFRIQKNIVSTTKRKSTNQFVFLNKFC
ncbi:unnamed protein product [Paramecium primaurelia]|uniref:Uncharacterized protein n=1 Tax=Paramecium primaurelia TaxID=5886 RepID=A0A8S1PJ19_PARPR|nr:unnamed protein product [Paramecium primaurelia]